MFLFVFQACLNSPKNFLHGKNAISKLSSPFNTVSESKRGSMSVREVIEDDENAAII